MTEQNSRIYTFIQLNLWLGRLYYPLHRFLTREKPDIFSAQEMITTSFNMFPAFYTVKLMIEDGHFDRFNAGLSRNFLSPNVQVYDKVFDIQEHCVTLTQNLDISFENKFMLHESSDNPTEREQGMTNYAGLLHSTIQLDDGAFVHVLNYHNPLVKKARMGNEISDINFKIISEYISTLSGPVIFSGDFNLNKEATSLQPLKDIGLTNLNDVHSITVARNEFSFRPEEAVCHLFINDQIIVNEYRIPPDNVSDHLPLLMKFQVKDQ